MRDKWIAILEENNALGADTVLNLANTRICGAHFSRDSFSMGTTKLLPQAVPSVFPKKPIPTSTDGQSSAKKRKYEGKIFRLVVSQYFGQKS